MLALGPWSGRWAWAPQASVLARACSFGREIWFWVWTRRLGLGFFSRVLRLAPGPEPRLRALRRRKHSRSTAITVATIDGVVAAECCARGRILRKELSPYNMVMMVVRTNTHPGRAPQKSTPIPVPLIFLLTHDIKKFMRLLSVLLAAVAATATAAMGEGGWEGAGGGGGGRNGRSDGGFGCPSRHHQHFPVTQPQFLTVSGRYPH